MDGALQDVIAMFSQDEYLRALHFAAAAHGEQKTPVGHPYIVHVTSVAMELLPGGTVSGLNVAGKDRRWNGNGSS